MLTKEVLEFIKSAIRHEMQKERDLVDVLPYSAEVRNQKHDKLLLFEIDLKSAVSILEICYEAQEYYEMAKINLNEGCVIVPAALKAFYKICENQLCFKGETCGSPCWLSEWRTKRII
jgi:hypothetical protein